MTKKHITLTGGALLMALYSVLAWAEYRLDLQEANTLLAREVHGLHTWILILCVVIFVGVFGAMFWSIIYHRKSIGHEAAHWHENTTVEVLWTVIPFIILVGIAVFATRTVLAMRDTSAPDMTIKVTGYQWKWGYEYLDEGISFTSSLATPRDQIEGRAPKGEHYLLEVDNPMVVPAGKKVRILLTAGDVIHAWMVPALAVKQDAIPGFIRDTHFRAEKPGVYRGQCAELCGKDHGFMPIEVHVLEQADYDKWVAEQQAKSGAVKVAAPAPAAEAPAAAAPAAAAPAGGGSLAEVRAAGEKVYGSYCAACHQANGKGIPGSFPAIDGSKVASGPKEDHIKLVLSGRPGTAMASFKQLSDADLAAVITFQRNNWGNDTGDVIQPAQVAALRQ